MSRALRQHDAAIERAERERIAAAIGRDNEEDDFASQITMLMDQEILIVRSILRERAAGGQVSPEQLVALRQIHRKGLALRRRCGDPLLDAELSWFQGLGSLALMADLYELDLADFDHELTYRTIEVRRALTLRSMRTPSG